jgi:hypothetical protein
MFFHVPLGDAEAMRKVSGGTPRASERLHDLLPDSAWVRHREKLNGVGKGFRTPDLRIHNPAL